MADIFQGIFKGQQTAKPSGVFSGVFGNKITQSTQTSQPSEPTLFFTGKGYGVSQSTDPFSGRPLLTAPLTIPETYNTPEQKISVESPQRVATTFDPTKAQPLTRDLVSRSGDRLPESASQAIRNTLGAAYNEDLDHQIALTLSGSNAPENLKLIPTSKNQAAGGAESQLARDVISGKISLLDAQLQDAKMKGIKLPESAPTLIEKIRNEALKVNPEVLQSFANIQQDPLGLKGTDILQAPKAAWDTIYNTANEASKKVADFVVSLIKKEPASKIVGKGLSATAGTASAVLSPIGAVFSAAEKVPLLKGVSNLFTATGAVLGEGGKLAVDRILDKGILSGLSPEAKNNIRQGAEEVGSLTAQLVGFSLLDLGGRKIAESNVLNPAATSFKADLKAQNPELATGSDRIIPIDAVPNSVINKFIKQNGREGAKAMILNSLETANRIKSGDLTPEKAQAELQQTLQDVKPAQQPLAPNIPPSLEPLAAEARKYKSADEFVRAQKPVQVSVEEISPTPGHTPKNTTSPVRPEVVKEPIRVEFNNDGKLQIQDGNHRYFEAVKRGDKTVPVIFNEQAPDFNFRGEMNRITDFYNKAVGKVAEPVVPTETTRTAGIANRIEAKAIEDNLVSKVENKAQYNPQVFKDQSTKIADFINQDINTARDILRGDKPLPQDLNPSVFIEGMRQYATKNQNPDIIYELANSPLASEVSVSAQTLGGARLIEKDSAYKDLQEAKKFREEKAAATTKETPRTIRAKLQEAVKVKGEDFNLEKVNQFITENLC